MNFHYEQPAYEQSMYYIRRAHQLRGEAWRKIFAGIFKAPVAMAGRFSAIVDSIANDKRIAP